MAKKNGNTKPSAQRYRQQLQRRARAIPLPDGYEPEVIGATAALYVAQYRQRNDIGPTWGELSSHLHPNCRTTCAADQPSSLGWKVVQQHRQSVVSQLIKAGWLTATRKPRSLTVPSQ